MLLTISTTYKPATDLACLLHKNPFRCQAAPMRTSRAVVNRLLDEEDTSVTLATLARASAAIGVRPPKSLWIVESNCYPVLKDSWKW
jgi:hypothetical protein